MQKSEKLQDFFLLFSVFDPNHSCLFTSERNKVDWHLKVVFIIPSLQSYLGYYYATIIYFQYFYMQNSCLTTTCCAS